MPRFLVLAPIAAVFLALPGAAFAQDGCELRTRYVRLGEIPPAPTHTVGFVFTGVNDESVVLTVDETPILESRLTTEDWSTEFSGATRCLMAGRYRVNVKIGTVEGNLHLDVSEETTIYLSARDGVLTFNIWGPAAPGLD